MLSAAAAAAAASFNFSLFPLPLFSFHLERDLFFSSLPPPREGKKKKKGKSISCRLLTGLSFHLEVSATTDLMFFNEEEWDRIPPRVCLSVCLSITRGRGEHKRKNKGPGGEEGGERREKKGSGESVFFSPFMLILMGKLILLIYGKEKKRRKKIHEGQPTRLEQNMQKKFFFEGRKRIALNFHLQP